MPELLRVRRWAGQDRASDPIDVKGLVHVAGGLSFQGRRWDAVTGTPVGQPWRAHPEWGYQITSALVNGRAELITTGEDNVIRRWDAETAGLIDDTLTGQSAAVFTIPSATSMIATALADRPRLILHTP